MKKGNSSKGEVLFDESIPEEHREDQAALEEFEDAKPLAEELIDTLIDMLFFAGFTLPTSERLKTKVSYTIWSSGIGCNTPISTYKELENNRTEVLRLLLTLTSKAMYMPASQYLQFYRYGLANYRRCVTRERSQGFDLHSYLS